MRAGQSPLLPSQLSGRQGTAIQDRRQCSGLFRYAHRPTIPGMCLPGSTFYTFTYELVSRGVMSGYPCGGAGEPCGLGNLPYFRPQNNVTRGQTSKIVANTFFPDCSTPLRRGK